MSLLVELLKDIFSKRDTEQAIDIPTRLKKILNVGGGNKSIPIPSHYSGWQHDLLDIDPRDNPDIVCDARKLATLPGGSYDAIYCSHNLEHYYRHDGLTVVKGFFHMLHEHGFAEIRVPDIAQVISLLVEKQLGLDDLLYESAAGPITAHDVIYGWQTEIKSSGQDFYAHKTGFTAESLAKMLAEGGFHKIYFRNDEHLGVHAFAFKTEPTAEQYAFFEKEWDLKAELPAT